MTGTFWAILPPVIAIVLALITKEVYLSLMIGIASGALMYHNFHLIKAMDTIFAIMGEKIGANCDILIFSIIRNSGSTDHQIRCFQSLWKMGSKSNPHKETGTFCNDLSWSCDLC